MKVLLSSSAYLLISLPSISVTFGFVPTSRHPFRAESLALRAQETEEMRHDIEEMRKEALRRLEALEHQVEELQHLQMETKQISSSTSTRSDAGRSASWSRTATVKSPASTMSTTVEKSKTALLEKSVETSSSVRASSSTAAVQQQSSPPTSVEAVPHAPLNGLDDTRWRVAFNIGREPGTWMPPDWGASGDRLRFQVVLDFMPDAKPSRDEFFSTSHEPTKLCKVVEGFVFPSGVGKSSVGRQQLPVKANGIYQISRGQGPSGTDILRFYIALEEDVYMRDHESDVYVPAGRVYGTCGYFSSVPHSHALKENLAAQHRRLLKEYEDMHREMETETTLFSMERIKRMKTQWELRSKIEKLAQEVQRARQQDPERAQLRPSRKGDVALTKDGGVCCKVQKGVSVEYRILGKMELGSVEIHGEDEHIYDDAWNMLHHP